ARWSMRREGRAPDATRLSARMAPDPLAQAQAAEFTTSVDAAIERLPAAYQPVLRLPLNHQFKAGEIAPGLSRPSGTVRKQIVRGLVLLRGLLPAGLTLTALALVTPGRGLAAVREIVLLAGQAAGAARLAAAGAAGATVFGGVLTMKKLVLVAAACLLLAGALLTLTTESVTTDALATAAAASTTQPLAAGELPKASAADA